MNVSELYALTQWIEEEIEETQIPQKYQALQQILQRNTQPNQSQQSFESQKDALIDAISEVNLRTLTKEQLAFLRALGIAQSIGKEGVDAIEEILYKNALDIATAARKIKEIHQRLMEGIQKSHQIQAGLEGCVIEEEYEIKDEILIRVSFIGDTEITNVVDLKKRGNAWYEIGRGIAMAHDAAPEDVRVVGATRGSIIIELATLPTLAATVATIIYSALKLAEKVLEIRKKAEEIKNLQLKNQKLAVELEKEAKREKEAGVTEISTMVIAELNLNREREGDKVNALDRSIKLLVDFIESGGEIDFVLPENADEDDKDGDIRPEYQELQDSIQKIHQLEDRLRLLESGLSDD